MTAGYQPLREVEPQLSPEMEGKAWALMDAFDAAKAGGDALAMIAAAGALIDWQVEVGLLTVEDIRRMLLKREQFGYSLLTRAAIRVQELDPVAAEGYKAVAVDRTFDPDPSTAGWAALVVESFETAKDECGAGLLFRLNNDQIEVIRPLLKSWGYCLPPKPRGDE